jgi:hypothetical protein
MSGVTRIYPRRLRVPAAWRTLIEDEIERLLAVLDRIDGDPDLEPDDEDEEHDGAEPDTDGETDHSDLGGGSALSLKRYARRPFDGHQI